MGKSPELVKAVAQILHRDPETVTVAMRRLREAGLVEVTGKGRGGKAMTERDAATLLLAASGGASLRDAPTLAQTYWNLPRTGGTSPGGNWRMWGARPLAARYFKKVFAADIGPIDTFGTALTEVIRRVRDRALFPDPVAADWMTDLPQFHRDNFKGPGPSTPDEIPRRLAVSLFGPVPSASIRASFNHQWTFIAQYGPAPLSTDEDDPFATYLESRQIPLAALEELAASLR
jgi:hypothetical protein